MNLLLVGANEAVTGVLAQPLSKLGYRTRMVAGAEGARRLLSGERLDFVVVDLDDLVEDGVALGRWVRDRAALRNIPLLYLASQGDPDTIRSVASIGQVDFLMKPVETRVLHERIERLMWVGSNAGTATKVPAAPQPTKPDPSSLEFNPGVEEFAFRLSGVLHKSAVKIYQLLCNPTNCAAAARNIVSADAELSDAILQRVNDPNFGLGRRISNATQACALLGVRDFGAVTFKKSIVEPESELAQFVRQAWSHAIATGYVTTGLAEAICPSHSRSLGLAGILHGVGLVGLLEAKLDGYERVLSGAESAEADWAELERSVLGFDHAEVGASLAQQLHTRDETYRSIAECVDPARTATVGGWCVAVASAATQRYHSDFPRLADPNETLRQLALSRPKLWQALAPQLPYLFQAIVDQQEVFNS